MNYLTQPERLQPDYPRRVREYWTSKTWKKFLELEGGEHSSEGYAKHVAWCKLLQKKITIKELSNLYRSKIL
jgi:hypothetical protein